MTAVSQVDFAKFEMGQKLDASAVPDNPWFAFMEADAKAILERVSPKSPIAFAFTELNGVKAGANFEDRYVLVSFGLGDLMCRLCAAVVNAGMFPEFGSATTRWKPEMVLPESVATSLKDDFFHWSDAYCPWRLDGDRQLLFAFLLCQVNRFVVLHEAAHILHRHGLRLPFPGPSVRPPSANKPKAPNTSPMASQARELIADSQAFHLHFGLLEQEFTSASLDEMRQLLAKKLVATPQARLRITLLAAFMVFQMLDSGSWTIESARLSSHPPAPFRMKAIYATAIDLKHPGISAPELVEEIRQARFLGSAVVDIGLNRFPQLGWLLKVNGKEFDELFADIYAEMSAWADPDLLRSG